MQKIPATRIEFTYKEGRTDQMPDKWPVVFETQGDMNPWIGAGLQLRAWSEHAPATGGYDKTDFTVTWADGQTYQGRYDLKRHSVEPVDLGGHMREFLTFYAGRKRPDHLTEKQYQAALEAAGMATVIGANEFLERYEIG